ncbi:serine/threonine-protein kinase [Hyalangium rubrum]|uniref:Serine/threonine-protein kinase n=1 Tax=Hyalangium rubrum TaxID=3103134 RepID=A0ABU5HGJ1_9BACT|nr:serine/threonine-protein kinase [Hyalangium sp. s54d21]MDY7232282.1 serine/threonine-protein kinase [Hyalangium sp. s54d21]
MQDTDDSGFSGPAPEPTKTESIAEAAAEPSPPPRKGPETGPTAMPGELAGPRRTETDRVGRFLPLRVLGEGGMGVVYAAYDPDLDRKVALKLLRVTGGERDLELGYSRLLREAQAMARISHPNVIPVFEAAPWQGQVYVAMELVDGGTLREWVRSEPRSWREVLEKYLAAGRGLAAAHAAGLVHRDFKPANVLVGRDGRVFVTDFGLVRAVGESGRDEGGRSLLAPLPSKMLSEPLTQTGMVMGTPAYMSPEQFRGEVVDARSDQFSFCAGLYRDLYGQRPFDPDQLSRFAAARSSKGPDTGGPGRTVSLKKPDEATPASPILEPPRDARVPAWVRRAVMRGLSLEPADRFASMEALLEALSQEQRLAVKRRRLGVSVALAGVLGVAGAGAWWNSRVCAGAEGLLTDIWGPTARQRLAAAFEATGNVVAGERAQRVGELLDAYAGAWARQHTEACEDTRVRQVQTEELLSQRVVCLERRRKDLRAVVEALAGTDRAGVDKALDAVYALPSPQDCADLEALNGQQPRPADPALRAELEQLEGQVSEVKAQLDLSRYPVALEKARALEPKVLATGYLPLMAEVRFHLGWLQALKGEKEQGAGVLEQAVYDAEAGRTDRLEVSVLNKLLYVEGERKRFEHATRWARLGEATLQRLGGDAVLEGDLLVNQANLALMQDQPQQARGLLEKASERLARVLPSGHPKRARVAFTLGRTLLELGAFAESKQVLEDALRQTEAAVGPLHMDTARRHMALSMALRELKEYPQALEHAQANVRIQRKLVGPTYLGLAEALDEEGMSLLALKRYEEALKVYEEALAVKRQNLEEGDELFQYSYDGVGQALLGLGRTREALEPLRLAVTFTDAQEDSLGESGFALAHALYKEGQPEEARTEAKRAYERFTSAGRTAQAQEVQAWLDALPR